MLPHIRSASSTQSGTGLKRSSGAPEIPTIAQAGVPGYPSRNRREQ
jgi:hypothetical protein